MHQPLKRFTQCGSLTMLFAVFIILFGVSSTALTTFGKSNSQNVATPPPSNDQFLWWQLVQVEIISKFCLYFILRMVLKKTKFHSKVFEPWNSWLFLSYPYGVQKFVTLKLGRLIPESLSFWICAPTFSVKAKDCVTQADCIAMRDTSCVRDYPYQQLRCLCGDNKPPRNGVCEAKFKG